jgi:hypothetical protein
MISRHRERMISGCRCGSPTSSHVQQHTTAARIATILIDNRRMVRRALGWSVLMSLVAIAPAVAQVAQPPPPPDQPAPPPPDQPAPPPAPAPTTSAPGAAAPIVQPYPGQQVIQPAPPSTVMAKRWAIGVDVGPESYEPDAMNADKTEFGQLELAARYRIRAPIELGLAVHMAGSKDISAGGLYVDFRYRFRAEEPLNVYLLGGLGVLAVAHKDASDAAKQGRGSLRLGVGGEYRWNWFALIVELRLVGVGENKDLPAMSPETVDYQLSRYKLSGGSLAMGANFYF